MFFFTNYATLEPWLQIFVFKSETNVLDGFWRVSGTNKALIAVDNCGSMQNSTWWGQVERREAE